MTWQTPDGNRRLTGAEAELVRESLGMMVDYVSENIQHGEGDDRLWDIGVTLFDELTPSQRALVIRQVTEHLLTETPDTLELTAVNEAAAYAIFQNIATQIEIEIDMAKDPLPEEIEPEWRTYWRQRVLNAYQDAFAEDDLLVDDIAQADGAMAEDDGLDDWSLPAPESTEISEWSDLVESLADRILWDRDFEMAGNFLDAPPEKAAELKQMLGIDHDYFVDVADDGSDDGISEVLDSVRRITHAK